MTIKLEIPSNNKLVLLAGSVFLASCASAAPEKFITPTVEDLTPSDSLPLPPITEDPVVTEQTAPATTRPPILEDDRDSAGFTWDARIHAKTKTKNADLTWKILRRPANQFPDDPSWKAYIEQCKAEQAGRFPRVEGSDMSVVDNIAPQSENPAPVEIPAIDGDPTFPKLMKLITGSKGIITAQHLADICNDYELTAIKDLMKPDYQILIPTIFANLQSIIASA